MKKLFTTFLLLGVALFSWGQTPSYSFTNGVLTVPYDENMPGDPEGIKNYIVGKIDGLNAFPTTVTTLKLVGGFTNANFAKDAIVHKLVDACSKPNSPINLDLSACSDLVSKVDYTSANNDPAVFIQYLPNPANPGTQDVTRTIDGLTKSTEWFNNQNSIVNLADFPKYEIRTNPDNNNKEIWITYNNGQEWQSYWGNPVTQKDIYKDSEENIFEIPEGATFTENTDGTWTCTYTETVTLDATRFTIAKEYGAHLKGISFPNGSNFKAIPDGLCTTEICPNLESVTFGDQLEWIGKNAFKGGENNTPFSKLAFFNGNTDAEDKGKVSFPSTLKVIGLDAFYGCTQFTEVDLDLPQLMKVDAAAFNMVDDSENNLHTVYLPGQKNKTANETLTYWANQVFSSSHVDSLVFRYCNGITNFAYDGSNHFGEGSYTPPHTGKAVGSNTFYWHQYMTKLVLPPNLAYVAGGSNANLGMTRECVRLDIVEFTGRGKYSSDCTLTNGLVIPKYAFAIAQADQNNNVNVVSNPEIGTSTLRKLRRVILSDNITYITEYAFLQTSLDTLHIPASVQTIEAKAFEACRALKVVVFDDVASDCQCDVPVTTVKSDGNGAGAFNNCAGVTDVYVNRPAELVCENYAFDAATTYGRGSAYAGFATLHFPEDQLEHYVNVGHPLDDQTVVDPGRFHSWLMHHMHLAVDEPPHNGWWEFINSGPMKTNIDEEPTYQDIMLRTFSDYNLSYLVPDGLRAYIVNGYEKVKIKKDDDTEEETDNYQLTLKRLYVIPAKTGVILYGHPNATNLKGQPILSMTPVTFAKKGDPILDDNGNNTGKTYDKDQGMALCRNNWEGDDDFDPSYKNYLEPTSTENGGIHLEPYVKDDEGKVIWRNFIMSRFNTTLSKEADPEADDLGYMGFFRVVRGDYPAGYAYLKLKYDEYQNSAGNEILVKEDPQYYYEKAIDSGELYNAREKIGTKLNPRGWWDLTKNFKWEEHTKSWGERQFTADHVLVNLAELEDADGIVKLTIPADDITGGEYYTLQGVKVTKPTKGVYIRNGKKLIVK